jgi:FixJ family two-component response regulator
MPEFGANELLKELENRKFACPIVLMSGFSQTKLEFFLERPNVISIIQKPFRAEELQRAVDQAAQQTAPRSRQNLRSDCVEKAA